MIPMNGVLGLRTATARWELALLPGSALLGVVAGAHPYLALGLLVGLALLAILLFDLTAGLCLLTFASFFGVLSGSPELSPIRLAGVVLALTWLAGVALASRPRPQLAGKHPLGVYVLALFLAWAAFSVLWATDSHAVVTDVSRFGANLLLFPIAFAAVRRRSHAFAVAAAFVAGAIASTLYGVATVPNSSDVERLTGGVGDANELAAALVAAAALAAGLAAAARRGIERTAALAAVAICSAGVLMTLSRSGLAALAVAIAVGLVIARPWRRAVVAIGVLVALAAVVYLGGIATTQERGRVTTIEGGSGRSDLWTVASRMVQDRPVTGVGAGNFRRASPHYLIAEPGAIKRDEFVLETPKQVHNAYLQLLAELGAIGLALFLAVVGFGTACTARAWSIFRHVGDRPMEALAAGCLAGIAALLTSDVFLSLQFGKQFWLLLALGPALLALARRDSEA
jgi:O-antigen ligase